MNITFTFNWDPLSILLGTQLAVPFIEGETNCSNSYTLKTNQIEIHLKSITIPPLTTEQKVAKLI